MNKVKKDLFHKSLKVNIKNDYDERLKEIKREEFLDEIENNPELLKNLPIEKLKRLVAYMELSIKKKEEKLAKLKRAC